MSKRRDYTKFSTNKPEAKVESKVEPKIEEPVVEEVVETVEPAKSGVVVDCLKLNVREAPNAYADVVCVIDASTNLAIYEDESTDEFYKVCTESGAEGYCMKKFIKIIP